jgi:hypothetical protein
MIKITQKDLIAFNNHAHEMFFYTYNDAYNKSQGLPSRDVWELLNRICKDKFGICRGKITMKDVREYVN